MLLKYLAYLVVLAIYAAFAWTGRSPVEGFIVVLTGIISALGASHVSSDASQRAANIANGPNPAPFIQAAPTIVTSETK